MSNAAEEDLAEEDQEMRISRGGSAEEDKHGRISREVNNGGCKCSKCTREEMC